MTDSFAMTKVLGDFVFGFGTLFAIINPFGLAFVFLNQTLGLSEAERRATARRVALYAFCVLVVSLIAGSLILRLFGISLPALRIAGGLVVAVAGWNMLNEPAVDESAGGRSSAGIETVRRMIFFPLTVPLTTGPGTIAAAIALGASRPGDLHGLLLTAATSLAVAATVAVAIYSAYRNAGRMAQLAGPEGTRVITRLSAFLLLCVGVEIMLTGVLDVLRPLLKAVE
jgi:multiple antibiotic resistance protein